MNVAQAAALWLVEEDRSRPHDLLPQAVQAGLRHELLQRRLRRQRDRDAGNLLPPVDCNGRLPRDHALVAQVSSLIPQHARSASRVSSRDVATFNAAAAGVCHSWFRCPSEAAAQGRPCRRLASRAAGVGAAAAAECRWGRSEWGRGIGRPRSRRSRPLRAAPPRLAAVLDGRLLLLVLLLGAAAAAAAGPRRAARAGSPRSVHGLNRGRDRRLGGRGCKVAGRRL
mmetsp:Transcript_63997/g.208810  ORF Transcript_63997/g.208810 Transcript_63997/m.208810 type:complete len:226 (-) Transcript_63997:1376-2053(-)